MHLRQFLDSVLDYCSFQKTSPNFDASSFQSDRFDFHRSKTQTPSGFSARPSFPPLQRQRPVSEQLLAMQADGQLLLASLRRYLSMAEPAAEQQLRPFYSNGAEPSGPKKEASNPRPVMTSKAPGGSMKEPLTSVDGGFTVRGPEARFSSL